MGLVGENVESSGISLGPTVPTTNESRHLLLAKLGVGA